MRAELQVELKRYSSSGGLLEPMSKSAARRVATAAAAARAAALLFVFALFASSLHLTPRLSFPTEWILDEQIAQPKGEAHQPSRSRVQLRNPAASFPQQHSEAQHGLLSFSVCGDFADQRMALVSGEHLPSAGRKRVEVASALYRLADAFVAAHLLQALFWRWSWGVRWCSPSFYQAAERELCPLGAFTHARCLVVGRSHTLQPGASPSVRSMDVEPQQHSLSRLHRDVFDAATLTAAAHAAGIRIADKPSSLPSKPVELGDLHDVVAALTEQHATTPHLW